MAPSEIRERIWEIAKTLIRDLDEGHDNHQRHFNFEAIEALADLIEMICPSCNAFRYVASLLRSIATTSLRTLLPTHSSRSSLTPNPASATSSENVPIITDDATYWNCGTIATRSRPIPSPIIPPLPSESPCDWLTDGANYPQ